MDSIGVFGTQSQILATLNKLNFIDNCISDAVLDVTRQDSIFKAGIHAIMSIEESNHPTTLSRLNPKVKAQCKVVLFYWPVSDAFEHPNGLVNYGINRSNVSSLYLRILHEISDSVCMPVTMNEVMFYTPIALFCMFCGTACCVCICCVVNQVDSFAGDGTLLDDNEDDDDDDDDIAAEITTETVETTKDDVKLAANVQIESLSTNLSLFSAQRRGRRDRNCTEEAVTCYPIDGDSTNLLAFEFERDDRIEPKHDSKQFNSEQELSDFLQEMSKSHVISLREKNRDMTWREKFLIGSAVVPDLRTV